MSNHITLANTATHQALHVLISDDAYAMTFQSIAQYRAALLRHGALEHMQTRTRAAQMNGCQGEKA
jgi:hypothetical protein